MFNSYVSNTFRYDEKKCSNCGMCGAVCPHGVFAEKEKRTVPIKPEACMECGACQLNCPTGAITVDSGVGCASAMIWAALKGKNMQEATCGCGN